jgi:hypothetical protein
MLAPTSALPTELGPRVELAKRLGALVVDVRNRRLPQEEVWLDAHATWMGKPRRHFYVSDTFRHAIPLARRAVERFVVRAVQSLFPMHPPFEVFPGDEYDEQAGRSADAVRLYLTYLLEKRIPIRKLVTQQLRCLALYHRAVVCNTIQVVDAEGMLPQVWPTSKVVDPFAFYVWPETVSDLGDALLVFEDVQLPWQDYQRHVRAQAAVPIDPGELGDPEWPTHLKERLAHIGVAEPSATKEGADAPKRLGRFVSLSQVYFKSGMRWFKAWLAWNVAEAPRLVRLHPARYPRPPYHWALARPLPGEQYTTGMMDDIQGLQVLFNDQVNQGEEARTIAGLPPVAIDASEVNRTDALVYGPRRKWFLSDPMKNVRLVDIPDTSASSARAAQMTLALLNTVGGNNPATEGQPTRGLPRAGGAVMSLLSLAMADTKEASMIVEDELLTPTLADLHRLTLEFVPRQQVMRIPGTAEYPPQTVRKDDLLGDWALRWVGPQHAEETKARSQVIGQFAVQLAKVSQLLQQQGYMVRWDRLIKRGWRDTIGERGAEDIIVPLQDGTGAEGMDPQTLSTIMQMVGQGGGGTL